MNYLLIKWVFVRLNAICQFFFFINNVRYWHAILHSCVEFTLSFFWSWCELRPVCTLAVTVGRQINVKLKVCQPHKHALLQAKIPNHVVFGTLIDIVGPSPMLTGFLLNVCHICGQLWLIFHIKWQLLSCFHADTSSLMLSPWCFDDIMINDNRNSFSLFN